MPNDSGRRHEAARTPGNAHDRFFRSLVSNPDKVRAVFRLAFSAAQLAHFDLDTVAIEPSSWMDADELRERRADLVASVRLKSGEDLSVFVLAEHKSRPDKGLMVQLLKYQSSLYVQRRADAVLPVVVYHGKQPHWPGERTFLASRRLPQGFAEDFSGLLLSFGVSLVDLRRPSNCERLAEIDLEAALGFQLMADIWQAGVQTFAGLMERSLALPVAARVSFLKRAALYLLMVNSSITIESMNREVQKRLPGDEAMESIAQEWSWLTREQIMELCRLEGMEKGMEKGRQEGRQEGHLEIAERMMKKGMSNADISEMTDLTLSEISQLKNGNGSGSQR